MSSRPTEPRRAPQSPACSNPLPFPRRLEYLGDAVLDFLVTRRIFHDSVLRNPGELSDLRSALVNNCTFAGVIVRSRLHRFLRHAEPRLFRLLPQFESVQERREHCIRSIEVSSAWSASS